MPMPLITFSIVSHGQVHLIQSLLKDLAASPNHDFEVIVTLNIPEDQRLYQGFGIPLRIIKNDVPKGFGANHNASFKLADGKFFAILNPDIRIPVLDLNELTSHFEAVDVAAVAPLVYSAENTIEDSARRFPTVFQLFRRVVLRRRHTDYEVGEMPIDVDWVAGMFVVFRTEAFRNIGGFDDRRFFMYMEDVDICRRLRIAGWVVVLNPKVKVIHMAQRASRRNIKHMKWHAVSAFRYLTGL